MKKIFSFFAAMLVAVAVSAEPVVLPATLDVTNVSFRSEGMPDFVIEEGQDYAGTYFDMGAHDSSNDTLLYAEWDVTIEPLKYNLAVDVYNTNSWRVQIYLLNQAGDTLKDLRYKGSSGQKGQFSIGSIDMRDLAAGNYKLRARAATAWSAMKLKDIIVEADYQGANVALPGTLLPAYALLSANASIKNGAIAFKASTAPDEYATWNVSFAAAGDYTVTIDMTASNGHNYGVALLSADGLSEIGSVNEGGQKGDTGEKELGEINVPAAGNYVVKLTNAIQWSEAVLNSITFAGGATPEPVAVAKDFEINMQSAVMGDGVLEAYLVAGEPNEFLAAAPAEYNAHLVAQGFTDGHGYHQLVVDVPVETGNYKVTLGKCMYAYSADYTMAYVKNADQSQTLASVKQNTTSSEEGGVCYHQDPDNNVATMEFTVEAAQMVKILCAHYTPYIKFEKVAQDPTGLEDITEGGKVVKMIENGQMVIIKNGVRYNVQGAIMK